MGQQRIQALESNLAAAEARIATLEGALEGAAIVLETIYVDRNVPDSYIQACLGAIKEAALADKGGEDG